MTHEKSRKITSDIEKIIEDGKGWGSAWHSHDDKVQLDGTFSIQILRDIADLVERCKKEAKTYKKDIPWPDPLDHSEIKDSKEKCDQKFKDGIRYFQG